MIPKNVYLKEYKKVMSCVDVDVAVKQQIIRNCARHGTLQKIRAGKYKITAIKKENTTEKI